METFKAIYVRDGQYIREQSYTLLQDYRSTTIEQIDTEIAYPDVQSKYVLSIEPRKYKAIEIEFSYGAVTLRMTVENTEANVFSIAYNRKTMSRHVAVNDLGLILFDGPSPLFDYNNAIVMLGLQDGEQRTLTINTITPNDGSILPAEHTFHRTGRTISIVKNFEGERMESLLLLSEESFLLEKYYSGQGEYMFNYQ